MTLSLGHWNDAILVVKTVLLMMKPPGRGPNLRPLHADRCVEGVVEWPLLDVRKHQHEPGRVLAVVAEARARAKGAGHAAVEAVDGAAGEARCWPTRSWQAPDPSCLRLFMHCARRAASRAACTAGNSNAIKTAMIAITTRSSISVKPRRRCDMASPTPDEKV